MDTLIKAVEDAIKAETSSIEYHRSKIIEHTDYHTNAREAAIAKKKELEKDLEELKEMIAYKKVL